MSKTSKRKVRHAFCYKHHKLKNVMDKAKHIKELLKGPRNYDDGMGGFPDHDTPFMLSNNPKD